MAKVRNSKHKSQNPKKRWNVRPKRKQKNHPNSHHYVSNVRKNQKAKYKGGKRYSKTSTGYEKKPKQTIFRHADSQPNSKQSTISYKREDVWLGDIGGHDFEDVCTKIINRCGFKAEHVGMVKDGGGDILVWRGSDKIVAECKRQSKPIGNPVVMNLKGAVVTQHAIGGMLISTSGFTPHAKKYGTTITTDPIKAVKTMRNGILLVDLSNLRSMAACTGMMLRDGHSPHTSNVKLESLEKLYAGLKSSPRSPREIIKYEKGSNHIDTYYIVKVKLDQTFQKSVKHSIHRIKKNETYFCSSKGDVLKGTMAKIVKNGGDEKAEKSSPTAVKKAVVSMMKDKHTKTVECTNHKGTKSNMQCVPNEKHMVIDIKPVGVRRTSVAVKIMRKKYNWKIPWEDDKIMCRMCNGPAKRFKQLLICNDCGNIAHSRECGGKCSVCKKTICNKCSELKETLWKTKRTCKECRVQASKKMASDFQSLSQNTYSLDQWS